MKRLHRLFYPPAWSIAAKISTALLVAAIAPMSFTTIFNLRHSLESVEAGEYNKLQLLATSQASRLDQLITDIQSVVVQISSDRDVEGFLASTKPQVQKTFRPNLQRTLLNVFQSNPAFDAIFILDAKGKCVASTDATFLGQNYDFRKYFQQAIQGRSYISSILVGQTTKRPGLFFSHPVRSESGEIVGVTVLKIRGEDIWAIVNALQTDSESYAFLIDQQGIIISHPNQSFLYQSLNPLPPETLKQVVTDRRYGLDKIESLNIPELKTMVRTKEPGYTSYRAPWSQMLHIVGYAPLKVQPWVLGVNQPIAEIEVPLNSMIWKHGTSVLIVGGVTAIIALFLARSISRPIYALTRAAYSLTSGDFNSQLLAEVSRTQDDIGQLVRVFLHMAQEVKAREQKLKQEVSKLKIEIDETKKVKQVAEITENEHFRQLLHKIQKLKQQGDQASETETEYYQRLHGQVESLKQRSHTNC